MLDALNRLHKIVNQFDQIFIADSSTLDAGTFFGVRIFISSGLIDHCIDAAYPALKEILFPDRSTDLIPHNIGPMAMFGWVLAHEFHHGIRRHEEVLQEIGSTPARVKATEYDADASATAAVYRGIQAITGHFLTDIEIRKLAIHCLFWPVISLPGQVISNSHLTALERTFLIVSKLDSVRATRFCPPADTIGCTDKSFLNFSDLANLWAAYVRRLFGDGPHPQFYSPDARSATGEWDAMREVVARTSRTKT